MIKIINKSNKNLYNHCYHLNLNFRNIGINTPTRAHGISIESSSAYHIYTYKVLRHTLGSIYWEANKISLKLLLFA